MLMNLNQEPSEVLPFQFKVSDIVGDRSCKFNNEDTEYPVEFIIDKQMALDMNDNAYLLFNIVNDCYDVYESASDNKLGSIIFL